MEILFPLLMLGIGLVFGAFIVWLLTRTKLQHEYARARAGTETERATLTERLAGKDRQLEQSRQAIDRETAQSDQLRTENAGILARMSGLETRLEEERKAAEEKLGLLNDAQRQLS